MVKKLGRDGDAIAVVADERDTGDAKGGKTLVGLVIACRWRLEGKEGRHVDLCLRGSCGRASKSMLRGLEGPAILEGAR